MRARWMCAAVLVLAGCSGGAADSPDITSASTATAAGPVGLSRDSRTAVSRCFLAIPNNYGVALGVISDPDRFATVLTPCAEASIEVSADLAEGAPVEALDGALSAWVDELETLDRHLDVTVEGRGLDEGAGAELRALQTALESAAGEFGITR